MLEAPPKDEHVLLPEIAAARILTVQPSTLTSWRFAGKGPTIIKVGRAVRYKKIDLEKWLAERTVTHSAD